MCIRDRNGDLEEKDYFMDVIFKVEEEPAKVEEPKIIKEDKVDNPKAEVVEEIKPSKKKKKKKKKK